MVHDAPGGSAAFLFLCISSIFRSILEQMISCNVMVSFSSKQEIHEALVFVTRGSGDIVELFLLVVSRTRPLGNECDS